MPLTLGGLPRSTQIQAPRHEGTVVGAPRPTWKANSSEPCDVKLVYPSYQPGTAEPAEDLRVDATFEDLTATVGPVEIRCVKPQRKR